MSEETEQRISLEELPDYITTLERKLEEARKLATDIKEMVCGSPVPNWKDHWQVTHTRGVIADSCDAFLSTLEGEKGGKGIVFESYNHVRPLTPPRQEGEK